MSVFERLLQLYQNSSKTPFEDFTTEVLTGILEINQEIRDEFVNKVLEVDGADFSVYSQKKYTLANDIDCIVDMVFENGNTICFLENKVESPEGFRQLERYSLVLDEIAKSNKSTYLRYCSKYFDKKNYQKHEFHQFRWPDISEFLSTREHDSLINDFLDFLRSYGMGEKLSFNSLDLVTMGNVVSLVSKMNDYLELIKPKFKQRFGEKIKEPDNAKQILNENQYVFNKGNVMKGSGGTEIGVGFYFDTAPYLFVWVYWDGKNSNHENLIKCVNETDVLVKDEGFEINEDYFAFLKPVSDFLSDDKMSESIEKWYDDKFGLIRKFIDETPDLGWALE